MEITYIRKSIRPFKEVISRLLRSELGFIGKDIEIYYRELNELIGYATESIETYYTLIGDCLNIYNTNVSNKANDVMKVLTIFASIFIPLTFIAGIYGTNFEVLPELQFRYSYFIMLGIMVLIALSMLIYFRKNKWI